MHHLEQMIATHPDVRGSTNDALVRCIQACYDCGQSCLVCADACLGEDMVADLRQCIRLNQDCADLCFAAGALGSRRTGSNEACLQQTIMLCGAACAECATECERHAGMHEHCRICAEACRECAEACRTAAASITPSH